MRNEKNDIEQLFSKKFEKYEVKSSEQEWLDISTKLSKVNFLKFSFVSFNVYYLAMFLALAGTTTYSGIRNFYLSEKVQQLESSIQSYQRKEQLHTSPDKHISSINTELSAPLRKVEKTSKIKDDGDVKVELTSKPKVAAENDVENLGSDLKPALNSTEAKHEPSSQANTEKISTDVTPAPISVKPDSVSTPRTRKVVKKTFVMKPKPVIIKDTLIITKTVK